MIDLTWRQIARRWQLDVAVWLCLTLACALAASLSGYADAIAAQELRRTWDDARPARRSLLITGPRSVFTEAMYANLKTKLGSVVMDRMEIRHATVIPDPPASTGSADRQRAIPILDVYAFDKLSESVRVVDGKLPDTVNLMDVLEPWRPPPIEAVIGVRAAAQSGYRIGDELTASSKYHRLTIVGIVEPIDPRADIWGEDLSAFAPVTNTLPLIIDSDSMQSFYPFRPIFPHAVSWRVKLDPHLLSVADAETLHSNLINLQTQAATVHVVIDSGLVKILADYLAQLSRLRMVLWLLTTQTLIVVLYALAIFASLGVHLSRAELAMLSGRGASPGQITLAFAVEGLVLASMAMIAGPGLVLGPLRVWAEGGNNMAPTTLPTEAWLLAGAVALLGWLVLALPVILAARRDALAEYDSYARPPQQLALQKRYLDLYLLAFGALLYWQLNQSDSFVMSQLGNTFLADPLLLIGPSLLLVGEAMVLLRVSPFVLNSVLWLCRNLRGPVLSQSLLHLTQDSQSSNQVVLLVSLTTGLVLFTRILGDSLAGSPEPMMRYLASALQVNTLALVLFSVTMFFLMQLFAAQRRAREFEILRALGLSFRQWPTSLLIEGALSLFLGLAAGGIVGLALSNTMIPFLAQALIGWQIGVVIQQASVTWAVVAKAYVLLIALYGLMLVLLWGSLRRLREHRGVKMEGEP